MWSEKCSVCQIHLIACKRWLHDSNDRSINPSEIKTGFVFLHSEMFRGGWRRPVFYGAATKLGATVTLPVLQIGWALQALIIAPAVLKRDVFTSTGRCVSAPLKSYLGGSFFLYRSVHGPVTSGIRAITAVPKLSPSSLCAVNHKPQRVLQAL